MHGDALLLIVAMVFGCAAFFFGVIYLFCRAIAWVGLGFAGIFRSSSSGARCGMTSRRSRRRICPREECRKMENRADAQYCSRCGAPLTALNVDHHDNECFKGLST